MTDYELLETRLMRGNARYSFNAEFKEEDHPRGEDGKFGTGYGGKNLHEKHINIKKLVESISKNTKFQDGKQSTNAKEMVKILDGLGIKVKYNDDFTKAPLQMTHGQDVVQINGGCDFWRNPKKMFKPLESNYSSSNWTHVVAHEMAHIGSTFGPNERDFIDDSERKTAEKVSKYAGYNKNEFIAEFVAGVISGKDYPEEVDLLYNKYIKELN